MEIGIAAEEMNDFIASLGTIYGVAEIRSNRNDYNLSTPVLVADNALVFFAWDELEAGAAGN